MDFSGLLILPIAALITGGWTLGSVVLSKPDPGFRRPFFVSYVLGVLFMEPWHIASWQQAGMIAVMTIMLLFPTALGCGIGRLCAKVITWIGSKLRRRSSI